MPAMTDVASAMWILHLGSGRRAGAAGRAGPAADPASGRLAIAQHLSQRGPDLGTEHAGALSRAQRGIVLPDRDRAGQGDRDLASARGQPGFVRLRRHDHAPTRSPATRRCRTPISRRSRCSAGWDCSSAPWDWAWCWCATSSSAAASWPRCAPSASADRDWPGSSSPRTPSCLRIGVLIGTLAALAAVAPSLAEPRASVVLACRDARPGPGGGHALQSGRGHRHATRTLAAGPESRALKRRRSMGTIKWKLVAGKDLAAEARGRASEPRQGRHRICAHAKTIRSRQATDPQTARCRRRHA